MHAHGYLCVSQSVYMKTYDKHSYYCILSQFNWHEFLIILFAQRFEMENDDQVTEVEIVKEMNKKK